MTYWKLKILWQIYLEVNGNLGLRIASRANKSQFYNVLAVVLHDSCCSHSLGYNPRRKVQLSSCGASSKTKVTT